MSNIVEGRKLWLTNRRWSLRDIDEIRERIADGWDTPSLAEAYLVDVDDMAAMLQRNDLRRPSSFRPGPDRGW
jgi:hypothetical protein